MKIPGPRESLAGCVWLPRILAKARDLKRGVLPPDYEARFCHPSGVDGLFLAHFGLTREAIFGVTALPDAAVAAWFQARTSSERIEQWNQIALNLGRSGYPMADRLPVALAIVYKHVDATGLTTVFEVLEADEKDA